MVDLLSEMRRHDPWRLMLMYEVGEDRYVTFYKMSALEFAAGCDLDYHQTLVGHILFFFPCGCSNFVGGQTGV